MPDAVTELDPKALSPMQRKVNKELMVAFINADLAERAALDVRRSTVFYDGSRTFVYADREAPAQDVLDRLGETTSIRFWSKGC